MNLNLRTMLSFLVCGPLTQACNNQVLNKVMDDEENPKVKVQQETNQLPQSVPEENPEKPSPTSINAAQGEVIELEESPEPTVTTIIISPPPKPPSNEPDNPTAVIDSFCDPADKFVLNVKLNDGKIVAWDTRAFPNCDRIAKAINGQGFPKKRPLPDVQSLNAYMTVTCNGAGLRVYFPRPGIVYSSFAKNVVDALTCADLKSAINYAAYYQGVLGL